MPVADQIVNAFAGTGVPDKHLARFDDGIWIRVVRISAAGRSDQSAVRAERDSINKSRVTFQREQVRVHEILQEVPFPTAEFRGTLFKAATRSVEIVCHVLQTSANEVAGIESCFRTPMGLGALSL